MRFLQPTPNRRLNEPIGFLLLILGLALGLSLVSHQPLDPSLSVAGSAAPHNLLGYLGSYTTDLLLPWLGLPAFLIPLYLAVLGWHWVRSTPLQEPLARLAGSGLLMLVACVGLTLAGFSKLWLGTVHAGGVVGLILADSLAHYLNETGAALALIAAAVLSGYLLSSFTLEHCLDWLHWLPRPASAWEQYWQSWRQRQKERARLRKRASGRIGRQDARLSADSSEDLAEPPADSGESVPIVPYEGAQEVSEDADPAQAPGTGPPPDLVRRTAPQPVETDDRRIPYRLPTTGLLIPAPERGTYDPGELRLLGRQICAKFEEFGVRGSVAQINPGPVVTTFEFKPDPGIKYSKIVHLSEDLCLALECESILVERLPGKATVGIEVPNRRREIISLRESLESSEFTQSSSYLTMALGKDISGRIWVADLDSMPHLLVAGSTGSGKSVLINSMIMSILMKATPDQVRFIMIDPKTVELGLYLDIPHLLTPVITDMKKASNALKNATREMERRLKLLAEHGVRHIDQYNRKIAKLRLQLEESDADALKTLPYIVIIIDELADLMMIEGRQIEEAVTRLAQMARAVGIHLVLATQRPSVDVITGLIKANIPARISFRLATRVDSRTILDAMGAEALLGRGDMLFLPPGTARMVRLHGPLVTEEEVQAVVRHWKQQGPPDYETAFLAPPASDSEEDAAQAEEGFEDPAYEEALRIVLDMGKASTSTLQRRLRLGYGRAARILDAMERDGIIGPPDGSRPREVLKRPDWLAEMEHR